MISSQPPRETVDLRSYARLLWRRKWVVILPAVLAAVTAFVATLPRFVKPVYRSSVTLLLEPPAQFSKGVASMVTTPAVEEQISRLQTRTRSSDFLVEVGRATGIRESSFISAWADANRSRYPDLSLEELKDLRVAEFLRTQIDLRMRGGQSGVSTVQVITHAFSPDGARQLAQTIATGFIDANRREQNQSVRVTEDFSRRQLEEYDVRLKEAQSQLDRFLRRYNVRASVEQPLVRAEMVPLVNELRARAESDRREQERRLDATREQLREQGIEIAAVEELLTVPAIGPLIEEARDLERDYVRQTLLEKGTIGPVSQSAAITLARKIEDIATRLEPLVRERDLDATRGSEAMDYLMSRIRRDLAQTRRGTYDSNLVEFTNRIEDRPEADAEFQRLQGEVTHYKELRETFLQQMASSEITGAIGTGGVGWKISVLEPADLPLKPVRPKRLQLVLISVLAGLALGVAGSFFLELHDPSYRDPTEVERDLGMPVLGTIPTLPDIRKLDTSGQIHGRSMLKAGAIERAVRSYLSDSPGYQEFRKLSLALLRSGADGPRRIMITSARRGEGKSTTSACLALAMAKEQPEERIVLVDLDVRKNALVSMFGLSAAESRGSVSLRERAWEGDPLHPLILDNLWVLTVGAGESAVEDLVNVESARWLLEQLHGKADRLVIDAPPNLPVPDALVVGAQVDAVLVVVGAGETPRETVRRGLALQRQFRENIVGIVLNDRDQVLPYYYSPKHYGYGYAYGGSRRGRA